MRSPLGSITTTPRPASMSPRARLVSSVDLPEPVAPMTWRWWRASGTARATGRRPPAWASPSSLGVSTRAARRQGRWPGDGWWRGDRLGPGSGQARDHWSVGRWARAASSGTETRSPRPKRRAGEDRPGGAGGGGPSGFVPRRARRPRRRRGLGPAGGLAPVYRWRWSPRRSERRWPSTAERPCPRCRPHRLCGWGRSWPAGRRPGSDEVDQSGGTRGRPSGPSCGGRLVQASEAPAGDGSGQDLHAGGLTLIKPGQGAEQRAQGVDFVFDAQGVVLGPGQAQLTSGCTRRPTSAGRRGRSRCVPRAKPPRQPGRRGRAGRLPAPTAMASPPSEAVTSKPRCGWPPSSRRHAGRSRATRLVHRVVAP